MANKGGPRYGQQSFVFHFKLKSDSLSLSGSNRRMVVVLLTFHLLEGLFVVGVVSIRIGRLKNSRFGWKGDLGSPIQATLLFSRYSVLTCCQRDSFSQG